MKVAICFLVLVLCSGVVSAGTVLTWSDVRVVTTDGWEYPSVSVECRSDDSRLVIVFADGARRSLDRARLRVITDSSGEDITEAVMRSMGDAPAAEPMAPADETPLSRAVPSASESVPARAEETLPSAPLEPALPLSPPPTRRPRLEYFHLRPMLTAGPGFGAVSGEWYEGLTSGLLFDFSGRIPITTNMYLSGSWRRQSLGVESSFEHLQGYDDYGNYIDIDLDWDIHVNELFFALGITNHPQGPQATLAYFEMGLGNLMHSIEATASDGVTSVSVGTDESKGALLLGGGAVKQFNKRFGIDFGVDARFFWSQQKDAFGTTHYSGTGMVLAGRLAAVVFLGR